MASLRVHTVILHVLVLLLAGCSSNLTNRPPVETPALDVTPQQSTLSLPVAIDLAAVESKLNEIVPSEIAKIDTNVSKPGRFLGIRYSVSADVKGSVKKDGHITVRGQGDVVHAEIPISFSVTGKVGNGNRAYIRAARAILGGLQDTASGKLTVYGDFRLTINEDWKPKLILNTDFKWRQDAHFSIFGIKVTFDNKLNGPIQDALKKIEAQATTLLDPEKIKRQVADGWLKIQEPISLTTSPQSWLRLQPKTVSFSGISVKDNILHATLLINVDSIAVLGEKPPVVPTIPLPALSPLPPNAPMGFRVQLPFSLAYQSIRDAIIDVAPLNKPIAISVKGEVGHVTIKQVEVFPSQGRLAIGAKISADLPGHWLDVNGWFYVLALPEFIPEREVVRFEGFELSRLTDNWLVNAATAIVAIDPVRHMIEERSEISYKGPLDVLLAKSREALNRKLADNVQIKGNLEHIEPGTILVGKSGLLGSITADGSLEFDVGTGI